MQGGTPSQARTPTTGVLLLPADASDQHTKQQFYPKKHLIVNARRSSLPMKQLPIIVTGQDYSFHLDDRSTLVVHTSSPSIFLTLDHLTSLEMSRQC